MREGVHIPTRAVPLITFDETPGAWFCGAGGQPPALQGTLALVAAIEKVHSVSIHVVRAGAVCGPAHLASALLHSRRAQMRQRAHARDPKVELMLYLAGTRQISRAMAAVGIGPDRPGVAMAIEGGGQAAWDAHVKVLHALDLSRDDALLEASAAKAKALGVAGKAADAEGWEALAIEKVAVLDIE